MTASYYQYWGKAKKDLSQDGADYHLLPYHCLDVAAVADVWWENSPVIRSSFVKASGYSERQSKAWVLFFVALHDYGKFDVRFQMKAPHAWRLVNKSLSMLDAGVNQKQINEYYHGPAGVYWLYHDHKSRFEAGMFDDNEDWDAWVYWFAPVAGHHGSIPEASENSDDDSYALPAKGDSNIASGIKQARLEWLQTLESLFLLPVGLSLQDNPPLVNFDHESAVSKLHATTMLAGFCSISDWLGSSDYFEYDDKPCVDLTAIQAWYQQRLPVAKIALGNAGIISQIRSEPNMAALLDGHAPRQVQCLIPQLPVQQSLTLIEASTGAGKTEAALSYAWSLLALGLADSIVFALPTQATANAMLARLEAAAPILFTNTTNVVLAHGRANYQSDFINLKEASSPKTKQGAEEAWVQCGQWLSESRKRVFLGQIGVCTVDQVLVSVLPIKHKFVRGFGIGRSVLIVDEVHAYDSYMYGLLSGVLEQQRMAGGSAILLSATLPSEQKQKLAKTWHCQLDERDMAYPMITHCSEGQATPFDLEKTPSLLPEKTTVKIELLANSDLLPDAELDQQIVDAVRQGAQVCLVCNLVDVAQRIFKRLLKVFEESSVLDDTQIMLFHSRFIFTDRQIKEQQVQNLFGKNPCPENAREKGHLLIATQVVEQSLDVDFDWLITQLCPVDLLFQRIGRLHRHERSRPKCFENKRCSLLVPDSLDYQLHALIYGNSRVLWRTHQLLAKAVSNGQGSIVFPDAYRTWIELVYQDEIWSDEPESVQKSYALYEEKRLASHYCAKSLMLTSMNNLKDGDNTVSVLTRDGEMGMTVIPVYFNHRKQKTLLSGDVVDELHESEYFEVLNLNNLSVPKSWRGCLPEIDDQGLIWLEMQCVANQYQVVFGAYDYAYNPQMGFQRFNSKEKDSL